MRPLVRRKRQVNRGALPRHVPREEAVIDLDDENCPCCNGLRVKIGEDVSERLDMIRRGSRSSSRADPNTARRACEGEMARAPAPEHLIESGIPSENLIAAVAVAKYVDHLPLCRPARMYGRRGVELFSSTLADWSGWAAFGLLPVY